MFRPDVGVRSQRLRHQELQAWIQDRRRSWHVGRSCASAGFRAAGSEAGARALIGERIRPACLLYVAWLGKGSRHACLLIRVLEKYCWRMRRLQEAVVESSGQSKKGEM